MTLQEEYPNAFPHFTTPDGFMKGSGPVSECLYCDRPTNWFEKALGHYFCSRECHQRYVASPKAVPDSC